LLAPAGLVVSGYGEPDITTLLGNIVGTFFQLLYAAVFVLTEFAAGVFPAQYAALVGL
jgi:hypothetical protein